jgi:competence protein ComEA
VRPGGRVGDAVDIAGGFAANADLDAAARALNLAQEVSDGMKVVVPAIGDGVQANGDGETPGAPDAPIDLNRATEAQLDTLPGVGPATIGRIVAAREEAPFATVEELRSRGIVGEATFGKLRDLVTVDR